MFTTQHILDTIISIIEEKIKIEEEKNGKCTEVSLFCSNAIVTYAKMAREQYYKKYGENITVRIKVLTGAKQKMLEEEIFDKLISDED